MHPEITIVWAGSAYASTRSIEDPEYDWAAELAKVPDLVRDTLAWSLTAIDEEYGKTSHIIAAVRNTERVLRAALRGLDSGRNAPAPEDNCRSRRSRLADVRSTPLSP